MRHRPCHRSADHSTALPARWTQRLESCLGLALDGVRLHRGPAAARIAAEAGGIACAVGGRDIFLGPVARQHLPKVLAHEVAHLAQQRRPGPPAHRRAAEAEADAAAHAVLAGRAMSPRLALDPRDPACWGEAGHYYTIYFVALAANLSDSDAYNCAFWAQIADEVEELNALPAGFAMMWEDMTSYPSDRYEDAAVGFSNFSRDIMIEVQRGLPSGPVYVPGRASAQYKRSQSYSDWLDVQRGLHALTGRPVATETERRTAFTLSYKPRSGQIIPFGMSLHPLGDSFAHRNSTTNCMYNPPEGHGLHGHTPDVLGDHRRTLYGLYVRTLHEVLTKGFGTSRSAILSADQTAATLDTIIPPRPTPDQIRTAAMAGAMSRSPFGFSMAMKAYEPDEETQIRQIRGLAASRIGRGITDAYNPERFKSLDFNKFGGAAGISIPKTLIGEARQWARDWS